MFYFQTVHVKCKKLDFITVKMRNFDGRLAHSPHVFLPQIVALLLSLAGIQMEAKREEMKMCG